MMSMEAVGRWLVIGGLAIVLLGGLIWLAGKFFPNMSQLPGTIRVQGNTFTCIIPLLASIILSILLTIILNVVIRFLNK
jgi:hypothetical protein